MKVFKFCVILFIIPFFAFTAVHKYYISVTQINYVKEQESVQIISRLFIDDFENVLRANYDNRIELAGEDEADTVDGYMETYLQKHMEVVINSNPATLHFVGKEYDGDIVKCYLEVEHVKSIQSFSITNGVLFDLQSDQQNIVKMNINSKNKSVILTAENPNALLKFN